MSKAGRNFSEREFYLAEFRGRSIGFAWPADEEPVPEALSPLVDALLRNETRVVLLTPHAELLEDSEASAAIPVVEANRDDFAPQLWRALGPSGCARLRLPAVGFEAECRRVAIALRLSKVVWIQSKPPVSRVSRAARVSVVDLAHLGPLLDAGATPDDSGFEARREGLPLLEAIRGMIEGGVPAVNVCAGKDVAEELLTYAGAGIFFTRDRYAEVRKLALDDFDPASDLISRGEEDGYLVPRDALSRDAVLAHGVGLFIEGRYLAGIGAILPYAADQAVEIASLYALTRYAGEGVGSQIVQFAVEQARRDGLAYVFCCTTSERVEQFFVRNGFRVVDPSEIPASKWTNYDPARRSRVRCLRYDAR